MIILPGATFYTAVTLQAVAILNGVLLLFHLKKPCSFK